MDSIFDTLVFESFTFLYEGEQAEAYKKRKAEEQADKEKKEKERSERRYKDGKYGDKYTGKNPSFKAERRKALDDDDDKALDRVTDKQDSDASRKEKAIKKANAPYYKPLNKGGRARNDEENRAAIDATNRHMRRHPNNESFSFFDDIEMI